MGVNGFIKKVMREIGIHEERFSLEWASAAEAPRFVQLITDFTNKIKKLGPLGHAEGLSPEETKERLSKALDLVNSQKVRVGFGNVAKTLRKEGSNLTDQMITEKVDAKLTKSISSLTA